MKKLRPVVPVVLALGLVAAAVLLITRTVAAPWQVSGESMDPALLPGDRVIVDLWTYRRRAPRPGEVAVFYGPGDVPMVKRVVERDPGTDRWRVAGDNADASLDSRSFGAVPRHRFRGRLVWRYWPPSRTGPIR